ncbi:MAG: hypothetical protein M5U16_15150 [Hyphomicrobium sp.]|nr:hypothetical protein [Hyphomicrobium sp.]
MAETETLTSEQAWSIEPSDFPRNGSSRDVLAFLVRYAVLAPSGHNTQPWRFVLSDDHVDIVADTSRALHMVDPHDREMTMSCAAAAETMFAALRAFGLTGALTPLPRCAGARRRRPRHAFPAAGGRRRGLRDAGRHRVAPHRPPALC